ncbi:MAG: InlB B-repeat-containing protein [Eubacteriaceae bacterium]|nr:InlB B-repeat-containing protein [Eubacteriaceae bacterium]
MKLERIIGMCLCIMVMVGTIYTGDAFAGDRYNSDEDSFIEVQNNHSAEELSDVWKELSDNELNQYISQSRESDIAAFISGLDKSERMLLLKKNTMLNNITTVQDENGKTSKKTYYEYVLSLKSQVARLASDSYTKKTGYCHYIFKDDDGHSIKYKVSFTIAADALPNQTTSVPFSIATTIVSGGANADIFNVVFSKRFDNMQKANTLNKELARQPLEVGVNSSGETIYKTTNWMIFVLNIKYTKPAYTYGKVTVDNSIAPSTEVMRGSRFNLDTYNWQNTGTSTFDKNVYKTEKRYTLTSCINMRSTGINTELAPSESSSVTNATMTIASLHPDFTVYYDKNNSNATVESTDTNPEGTSPVKVKRQYNAKSFGLLTLAQCGFSFKGRHVEPDEAWYYRDTDNNKVIFSSLASDKVKATALSDFTEGTYFTSKSRYLYANWVRNTYKVAYNANGGSGTMLSSSHTYDTEAELRSNSFVREGYKFTGWNTAADGSGKAYKDGATVKNLTDKNQATVTLYAQWTPNKATITYNANGGKINSETYRLVDEIVYNANGVRTSIFKYNATSLDLYNGASTFGLYKTGYHLLGKDAWLIDGKTGMEITSMLTEEEEQLSKLRNKIKTGDADIIMYANWHPNPYTVEYNANGGTGIMSDDSMIYDSEKALSKNSFKKQGFFFTGWNTAADGSGRFITDEGKVINLTSEKNGKVVLYAQWKKANPPVIEFVASKGDENPVDPFFINAKDGEKELVFQLRDNFTPLLYQKAYDCQEGMEKQNLTSRTSVVSSDVPMDDSSEGKLTSAGKYEIEYKVINDYGLETTLTGKIRINAPPEIDAPDRLFFINEEIGETEHLDRIKVNDPEDGNIEYESFSKQQIMLKCEDGEEREVDRIDTSLPGSEYLVKIEYTDSLKGTAKKTFIVKIADEENEPYENIHPRYINKESIDTLDPYSIWIVLPEYNAVLMESLNAETPKFTYELY